MTPWEDPYKNWGKMPEVNQGFHDAEGHMNDELDVVGDDDSDAGFDSDYGADDCGGDGGE